MTLATRILLNHRADGRLRFANQTMHKPLPVRAGEPLRHAMIAAMPERAPGGHVALPRGFAAERVHAPRLAGPGMDPAQARCHVPGRLRCIRRHDGSGR